MDSTVFIASGILESYALGMCSEEEVRQVEMMCEQDPVVKAELEQIQEAINGYAAAHNKAPKAETRTKVLAQINALQETEREPVPAISFWNSRMAVAASLVLFSLSLLGNILLYNKWKVAHSEVVALNSEKQQMADNLKSNQVKYEVMAQDKAIISNPDVMKVMMKGMEKSPESMAMVYWNKKSKEVFIEVKNLPMPEQGKQYQLWAIVDGKPVDAGMMSLTAGDSSLHRMKDFESAQAFAITLEKEGGVPSPTMSELVVLGAIGS
jgi:anti-sigma-K factor RskA